MNIVFLDNTALPGVKRGPGSPAFFSRYLIQYLTALGHAVAIYPAFEPALATADVVICEWCNEVAYEAAAHGCNKLIIRMRGYDVYGPLDRLDWNNVDALVYESQLLKDTAEARFPGLAGFRSHVIPSGVDIDNIPWTNRTEPHKRDDVIALIARSTADKGYQLAYEWARRRPNIELHVTGAFGDTNPRLTEYLNYAKPANVTVHGTVDTIEWLERIGASYLLSASIYESLGYTIAEAMAMGIKPLIHDAPGITKMWPQYLTWRSLDDLDRLMRADYDSYAYRQFVRQNLSAVAGSESVAALALAPPVRRINVEALMQRQYAFRNAVFAAVESAVQRPSDMAQVAAAVEEFRRTREPHGLEQQERHGLAVMTAAAFFNHEDYASAEIWACRALAEYARPDAMALLGDIADARGDVEEALQWYRAACAIEDRPSRYRIGSLAEAAPARLEELRQQAQIVLQPRPIPPRFLVIVAARNAGRWIVRCLDSIKAQTVAYHCVIVDDVSDDGTAALVRDWIGADTRHFTLVQNTTRLWQAENTIKTARQYATGEDVVVLVDGDDRLNDPHVLGRLNELYMTGAWMTYGGIVQSDGSQQRFDVYPKRILTSGRFQDWPWSYTHLRTFKRFLLDYLTDDDFKLNGVWPKMAGDVAMFLPMLQLARERVVCAHWPMYVYTTDNPTSEHHVDAFEQMRVRDALYARAPKERLEKP